MKRILMCLVAASVMAFSSVSSADMISSEQEACNGKAAGEACIVESGKAGVCKSEWNDWKKMSFLTCADPAKAASSSDPRPEPSPAPAPSPSPSPSTEAAPRSANQGCGVGGSGTGGFIVLVVSALAVTFLARASKKS